MAAVARPGDSGRWRRLEGSAIGAGRSDRPWSGPSPPDHPRLPERHL